MLLLILDTQLCQIKILADLITKQFEENSLETSNDTLILKVFEKSGNFMKELDAKYGKVEVEVDK